MIIFLSPQEIKTIFLFYNIINCKYKMPAIIVTLQYNKFELFDLLGTHL